MVFSKSIASALPFTLYNFTIGTNHPQSRGIIGMRSLRFVRLSILFVFVTTMSVSSLHAQREEILYYDEDLKVTKNRSEAQYFRVITLDAEGKPIGKVKDYYITGELHAERWPIYIDREDDLEYGSPKSLWKGELVSYYKNGQKKSVLTLNDEGALHGLVTDWYEDGTKSAEWQYEKGVMHGLSTEWYEDGSKRTEIQYRLGKAHGTSFSYHRSGTIELKVVFVDGVWADKWLIECDEFKRCNKIFNDKLRTNNHGWQVVDNEDFKAEFTTEGLLVESKKGQTYSNRIHLPIDIERDFSIEATFELKKGKEYASYGLIFGFKDWSNHFYSLISANGFYKITETFRGLALDLTDWVPSQHIRKSKNQNLVKVNKIGDQVVYSVNGQILETEEFTGFAGNYLGIYLDQEQTLLVKEFEVKIAGEPYPEDSSSFPYRIADVEWKGNGSGVVISTSGIIATNYHVIEGASEIGVELVRGGVKMSYLAQLRTSDKQNDLALIQVVDPKYQPFESVRYKFDTSLADVGTSVFTMGYPWALAGMGEEVKFTDGKISSKTGFQGGITTYQVTVPVQPGNSGGPLFDDQGNLVAIISSKINPAENVTYAIKSSYLNSLVEVLEPPIELPHDDSLSGLPLTEQIKVLSEYVALILVR